MRGQMGEYIYQILLGCNLLKRGLQLENGRKILLQQKHASGAGKIDQMKV